jgi:hypothetical protein
VTDLPTRLNVGCGRDVRDGWCNLDLHEHSGMTTHRDVLGDVAAPPSTWRVYGTNLSGTAWVRHFTEIDAEHIMEHIPDVLAAAENLWTVAADGCKLTVKCPHGASDDAWGDPTHVRPIFPQSFLYWGQGMYWRADYGYRGDWRLDHVTLLTRGLDLSDIDRAFEHVKHGRGFVEEMTAVLYAVKPARPAVMESQDPLSIRLVSV